MFVCCSFSDYKEYNTDTTVKFVVTMSAEKLRVAESEGLHKFFKLQTTVSLSSMVNIITFTADTGFALTFVSVSEYQYCTLL